MCTVSPYVPTWASSRSPCSSCSIHGGRTLRAPRASAAAWVAVRVVDQPGEIVHPVAVLAHVLGDRRVRLERTRHHEADVTLLQHVARLLPTTGLGPGVPGAAEAERRHQEPGRGAGVAHPELDAVPALEVPGRRIDGRPIGERSVHGVNDAAGAPRLATPRMRVPLISTSPTKEADGGTTRCDDPPPHRVRAGYIGRRGGRPDARSGDRRRAREARHRDLSASSPIATSRRVSSPTDVTPSE